MDSDEGGPGYAGPSILLLAATAPIDPGPVTGILALACLLLGLWLALTGSLAGFALNRFLRPRLLEEIEDEKRRERVEKQLEQPEDLAATAGLLRLLGIAGVLYSVLHWTGHSPTSRIAWLVVVGLLGLLLVEILPYALARRSPDRVVLRTLPVIRAFNGVAAPLLRPLQGARTVLLRALGVPSEVDDQHEELAKEIMAAVEDQERPEPLAEDEREWIENIVDLKDTTTSAVLTPRTDMVGIEVDTPLPDALRIAVQDGHSRVPVYEKKLDAIVGIFFVKDLLPHFIEEGEKIREMSLRELMRKPFFVPETKRIHELLREFRSRREHMAIVLDEYGGTAGLVTIEDVLEEIVGEIEDEFDSEEEVPIQVIKEGRLAEIDARAHVEEVNETFGLDLPEDQDYETLGGWICSFLGRIPSTGEEFSRDHLHFTILDAEERNINRIRLEIGETGNGSRGEGGQGGWL